MLLVDGDEAQARENDVIFDQSMGANNKLRFAGGDSFARGRLFRWFQSADEEFDLVAGSFKDAAGGQEMLDGENFRRSHERGLTAIFDGDDRGLERDDGFAAADITL